MPYLSNSKMFSKGLINIQKHAIPSTYHMEYLCRHSSVDYFNGRDLFRLLLSNCIAYLMDEFYISVDESCAFFHKVFTTVVFSTSSSYLCTDDAITVDVT
jgi:hypothetical protein